MTLVIDDPEADRMARELARRRGVSEAQVIREALREQLDREEVARQPADLAEQLMAIGRRFSSRPILDHRSEDEILGYDERGLPG